MTGHSEFEVAEGDRSVVIRRSVSGAAIRIRDAQSCQNDCCIGKRVAVLIVHGDDDVLVGAVDVASAPDGRVVGVCGIDACQIYLAAVDLDLADAVPRCCPSIRL